MFPETCMHWAKARPLKNKTKFTLSAEKNPANI